jgi:hypothetical protein
VSAAIDLKLPRGTQRPHSFTELAGTGNKICRSGHPCRPYVRTLSRVSNNFGLAGLQQLRLLQLLLPMKLRLQQQFTVSERFVYLVQIDLWHT